MAHVTTRKLEDFGPFAREGLVENDITDENINQYSAKELLDKILTWHGIIGFTESICGVFDDLGYEDLS